VKDFAGKNGQQGGRAAEQDREQIERDHAEHDGTAPDVGHAGKECAEVYGRSNTRNAFDSNKRQENDG
jgi:hypothetical protein